MPARPTSRRWWAAGALSARAGRSIGNRFALFAVALAAAFVLLLGGVSYLLGRHLVADAVGRQLSSQATIVAERLEQSLLAVNDDLAAVARNSLTVNALVDSSARAGDVQAFLANHQLPPGVPFRLSLHDAAGRFVAANFPSSISYADGPWWKKLLAQGRPHSEVPFVEGRASLLAAFPVIDPARGLPAGALVLDLPLDPLFRQAIRDPGEEDAVSFHLAVERLARLPATAENPSPSLTASARLRAGGGILPQELSVSVERSREDAYRELNRLALGYLVVGATLLLGVAEIARRAARRLTAPLRDLTQAAGEVLADTAQLDPAQSPRRTFHDKMPDGLITSGEQSRIESFNKRAEERLRTSLHEKDELRRELHRVKNKLVVAASLLELQKGHTENPGVVKMLDDIHHRIHTMALVDRKQSRAQALGHVLLDEYLEALVGYLTVAHQTARKRIRVHADLEPITLGVDTAMPCGLIVNELIGNAFEHAFNEAHGGDVWISTRHRDSGAVEIEVRDNGVGFPADLDPACGNSLGLQIATLLTRQLEGALTLERGSGTKFTLSFSELASRKRV